MFAQWVLVFFFPSLPVYVLACPPVPARVVAGAAVLTHAVFPCHFPIASVFATLPVYVSPFLLVAVFPVLAVVVFVSRLVAFSRLPSGFVFQALLASVFAYLPAPFQVLVGVGGLNPPASSFQLPAPSVFPIRMSSVSPLLLAVVSLVLAVVAFLSFLVFSSRVLVVLFFGVLLASAVACPDVPSQFLADVVAVTPPISFVPSRFAFASPTLPVYVSPAPPFAASPMLAA